MTQPIKIDNIIFDKTDSCECCKRRKNSTFIISKNNSCYCVDCLFGTFVVNYPKYLDIVLKSRSNSLEYAFNKKSPTELIGQCFRNVAILMKNIDNKLSVSEKHIYLCVGHYQKLSNIKHYWVAIGNNNKYVYIDPEMPIDNGGIWINNKIPEYYDLDEKIALNMKHKMPTEVRKRLNY